MARQRSEVDEQIAELLRTAKRSLKTSATFLTRMDGTTQHLEVVESSIPLLFAEGARVRQETSLCQAVHDGELPPVMPDLRTFPAAMALPAARLPRIRSFVTVPVRLSDGSLYGTFCAAGLTSDPELTERDRALLSVLASAAATLVEPGLRERARAAEVEARLTPVLDAGGPLVLLQPIVDLATGERVGAEALSRFPRAWGKAPDVCFAEAHSVGLGHRLELLALERAAEHLAVATGYVAMNVSPATFLRPECTELLDRLPLERVLLELSEHDRVEDYDALAAVLGPLRARGLRLAVDDVGAGFSSLRHIVQTSPDVLKLDRSIVDGVAADPVLRTLVRALVEFAHGCAAVVVAEGVETAVDAAALLELEVDLGQGWHFGRPAPATSLDAGASAGDSSGPSEPGPEPVAPVHVPEQRTPAARARRWVPWSASRGRRRAGTASGSYPGV
jgi:EAL domain-containing protein (putative c-di-GMP-specific phosphodiesterase class I)